MVQSNIQIKSNQFGKLHLEAPNWSTTALEKFRKMLTSTICTALLDFRAYSVIAGRIHINVQKMTTTPNFLSVDLFWYMYITRLYKRDNKWLQNIYFDIPEICFLKKRVQTATV